MDDKDSETIKYLKERDARILSWIKELVFLSGFCYLCYAELSSEGFFFIFALYFLSRIAFNMIFVNKTKISTLGECIIYLWKLGTVALCVYLLINYGFLGFLFGAVFAAFSSIIWLVHFVASMPDDPEGPKPPEDPSVTKARSELLRSLNNPVAKEHARLLSTLKKVADKKAETYSALNPDWKYMPLEVRRKIKRSGS